MDYICPVCKGRLISDENLIKRCESGHTFDRAGAGYYNLLLGRGGGNHGDNREMVEARRKFLSLGYYERLAERVAKEVLDHLPPGGTVLDLGAGEGYYTGAVARALECSEVPADILAIDISKDAVKHLARRLPQVRAAVASCYDLPIEDGSVDLAMLIFSPLAREEIHRVLKPRAKFLMVFPDEMHLFGLKEAIYKTPYKNKPEPTGLEGFRLLSDTPISYPITLKDRSEIESLFMMTPYAYRTRKEDKERLLSNDSLTTEVAFRILVYEKD